MIEVTSTNSYTIPANTTKIYTFKVSGYPNSTRLSSYGRISFQTGSVTSNLDITSCTIKAPNGKIFNAPIKDYILYRNLLITIIISPVQIMFP